MSDCDTSYISDLTASHSQSAAVTIILGLTSWLTSDHNIAARRHNRAIGDYSRGDQGTLSLRSVHLISSTSRTHPGECCMSAVWFDLSGSVKNCLGVGIVCWFVLFQCLIFNNWKFLGFCSVELSGHFILFCLWSNPSHQSLTTTQYSLDSIRHRKENQDLY